MLDKWLETPHFMEPWLDFPWFRNNLADWTPRMDAFTRNGMFVVKAELPGMKKDEVQVTLEEGDLVIQGERKFEQEVKEEDFHRMERRVGQFYRRLPLPFEVKPQQIKAEFHDGVLEVTFPKPVEKKEKAQKIRVS